MKRSQRNLSFDYLKGLGIISVILSHILLFSESTTIANSLLFRVIWSYQMPLFFIISGAVNSNISINNPRELLSKIVKRLRAYLIPFLSYILAYNLFNGNHTFLSPENLHNLLFTIDTYLWFLYVLLILNLIHFFSLYLIKFIKNRFSFFIFFPIFVFIFLVSIFLIGLNQDIGFLSTKLILYYSLFYFSALYFLRIIKFYNLTESRYIKMVLFLSSVIVLVSFSENFYTSEDNFYYVVFRFLTGYSYYFILYFMIERLPNLVKSLLLFYGNNSLEFYYFHFFFLRFIITTPYNLSINTVDYLLFVITSFLYINFFTYVVIVIVKSNSYLSKIILGKD